MSHPDTRFESMGSMSPNPAGEPGPQAIEPFLGRGPVMDLKDLLAEASRSLSALDADRLEKLAPGCAVLRRGLGTMGSEALAALRRQAIAAAKEMAVFGRVLEATRANLAVIRRLRELPGALEYNEPQARGWTGAEASRGDD